MADWIYVDNSNVFIEGQRASAVSQGMARDIYHAMNDRILDNKYRISFGKLYRFITGENRQETARAMLFGSKPPDNDVIWEIAKKAGFEVVIETCNLSNREKKIDTGIVAALMRDAYRNAKEGDVFSLVAGDSDYEPAIHSLFQDGFQVNVVFWEHASRILIDACSKFVPLDSYLDELRP